MDVHFLSIWGFSLWHKFIGIGAFDLVKCVRIWVMFMDNYSSCWDFDLDECVSIWGLCFLEKAFTCWDFC